MQCPVVAAIAEITGAGIYHDEDDTSRLIKIGGSDSEITYACDSASFYFTRRRLELARFELRVGPAAQANPADVAAIYDKYYSKIAGLPYPEAIVRLAPDALDSSYLRRQFLCAADSISVICNAIAHRAARLAAAGQCVNLSLPTLSVDMDVYDPAKLRSAVNNIVDFANNLNISSIVDDDRKPIGHLEEFTANPPLGTIFRPPSVDIAAIRALTVIETGLATYFSALEAYHCSAITLLNYVIDYCKKIINRLGAMP